MNYALARQLKDAGYPQKEPKQASVGYLLPDTAPVHLRFDKDWLPADAAYAPNLEELMESCEHAQPTRAFCLTRRVDGTWSLEVFVAAQNEQEYYDARTPLEATARFWLAQNPPPITPMEAFVPDASKPRILPGVE